MIDINYVAKKMNGIENDVGIPIVNGEHIRQLLRVHREIHAPEHLKQQARLKDFDAEYKRSVENPDAFWTEIAKESRLFPEASRAGFSAGAATSPTTALTGM